MGSKSDEKEINSSLTRSPGERRPRVIATQPDRSLGRYIVDEFKSKAINSRKVPFEAIDESLYKPKAMLVGFQTSECRLALWIKAIISRYVDNLSKQKGFFVSWEEFESYCQPGKPDKVKIQVKKDEIKLFVITVFVSTGRIQVQGSHYAEWSVEEFPLLMKEINKLSNPKVNNPDFNDDNSIPETSTVSTSNNENDNNSIISNDEDDKNSFYSSDEEAIEMQQENPPITSREILARLESDFTESKVNIEHELNVMKSSLEEINNLKDKIVRLENNLKANIIMFRENYKQNEENIDRVANQNSELQIEVKKLNDQKNNLVMKQSLMKSEIEDLKKENENLKKDVFILKELVQKHENAIDNTDANPDIQPKKQSSNEQIPSRSDDNQSIFEEQEHRDDLLLLIDSNGKFIKPNLLFPDGTINHCTTYTLNQVGSKIDEINYQPEKVILHCGTNDLEHNQPRGVIHRTQEILNKIKRKFNNAKVTYSALLPRQDVLNTEVDIVNNAMEAYCNNNGINFLQNSHIYQSQKFYDVKHLNRKGFKSFAKNLKHAIYETSPTKTRNRQQRQPRPNPYWQNTYGRGTPPPINGPPHFNWNNGQENKRSYAAAVTTHARPNRQALNQPDQSFQPSNQQINQPNLTGLPQPLRLLIHQLQSYVN